MIAREGTVVQAGDGMLTVKGRDGRERSLPANETTIITLNGGLCRLEELKAGTRVRVTPRRENGRPVLARVEAITGA
jgi:hypothetical protein